MKLRELLDKINKAKQDKDLAIFIRDPDIVCHYSWDSKDEFSCRLFDSELTEEMLDSEIVSINEGCCKELDPEVEIDYDMK